MERAYWWVCISSFVKLRSPHWWLRRIIIAEIVETQISNAEIKRVVLKTLREGGFNIDELEHLLRQVYGQIEKRHSDRTDYVYRFISRKYTKQVANDMKAQRKDDVLLLNNLYK